MYRIVMHIKKSFRPEFFENIFYWGLKILKQIFSKVMFLAYFHTVNYRAVEKNDFFPRGRCLAVEELSILDTSYQPNIRFSENFNTSRYNGNLEKKIQSY